jgi:hypothetical protein
MQQSGIPRVQELVKSALALLETEENDLDKIETEENDLDKVETIKNIIWPQIQDEINSCFDLSSHERGWLKYRLYNKLDGIKLQRGRPVSIDVAEEVKYLRTHPQAGIAPRVTKPPNLRIIP